MKKLLVGLSAASLLLLASCTGNKSENKTNTGDTPTTTNVTTGTTPVVTTARAKIAPKTDDTGSGYTKTDSLTVLGSVNQTKKDYETLITTLKLVIDDEKGSSVVNSTIAFELFTSWQFYTIGSSDNASNYKHIVMKYTFNKFDGLYYEYDALTSEVKSEGGSLNWYTNNAGGYRCVALLNSDYSACRIAVDWDSDGYRKNASVLSEGYDTDGVHFNQSITITYSYSK